MNEHALIGRTLGRYRILDRIGAGGMGEVYRARDEVLRRDVAVKVLPASASSDPDRLRRFEQEAQATGALNHPNILAIYDIGEYEGSPYAVSELLQGLTLRDQMAGDALSVRKAVEYAIEIARGLSAAHEKGIVHRDLKPENLFVTNDGRVKILDFGIAKLMRVEGPDGSDGETSAPTQTEVGVVLGTTGYMAPEQVRGEPVDQRADLFALGSVLYEMLAGRRAFLGATAADTMSAILIQDPPPLSTLRDGIAPDLDRAVGRCLEKNQRERFQTALDLASELERLVGDGALATPGHSPLQSVPAKTHGTPWPKGSPRIYLLGAVTIAAIAVVVIAWTRGWRPSFAATVPVVAVLPARNLSEDPAESAYLSEAFGEELVTRLGQASRARLLPWHTTQRFEDPKQRLEVVGRELHADKLVVGSFRSDGERVKVTVALVDARTGLQQWSQVYEESVEDLIALQRGVAIDIASNLGIRLSDAERQKLAVSPSKSPEAYEYYLRGANHLNSENPQSIGMAAPFFEQALALDPDLAVASVGLGAVKLDLFFRGQGGEAELDAAERAFRYALSLNPKLYSAVRGLIRVANERDQAEEILLIGSRLPLGGDDVEVLSSRGLAYFSGGLHDKAVPLFDRILELDPANQSAAWFRVIAESFAGESTRAIDHAKAYVKRYSEDPEIYTWLGVSLHNEGKKLQARLFLTRALELFGENQSNLYSVLLTIGLYHDLGETARADSLAGHWREVLDARLRANPDNMRVQLTMAALSLRLREPRAGELMDSLLVASESRVAGGGIGSRRSMIYIPDELLAYADITRLRRAFAVRQRSELAFELTNIRSGSQRLTLGNRYLALERLPEFRAYLAAVQRRHDELAARY